MIRTGIIVFVLLGATFFLPSSIQLVLYVLALLLLRHTWVLFIPAIVADAWYAPSGGWAVHDHRMVLIVLAMVAIYRVIIGQTRIKEHYGFQKN